ncbi:MKRN2 opposite strand protein isoform X1 [Prorops nasuta]|uniref:MKRN2 opposite strand protein isoform X1 n=1 Tax=Prorops nasuta TaxID=863751 RepID=UPI0034CE739E
MVANPGLICFSHCDSKRVFCKNVPEKCPHCHLSLLDFTIEPFQIPYPCGSARHHPCSIAVRPSVGTFLNDYDVNSDLHIAIVNSKMNIVEFDRTGLRFNDYSKWTDCITLEVIPSSWESHWDKTLDVVSKEDKWNIDNYHSTVFNCFTFVLDFLNQLNFPQLKSVNKENLCEKFILPKIQEVIRYSKIYRQLNNNLYVILN